MVETGSLLGNPYCETTPGGVGAYGYAAGMRTVVHPVPARAETRTRRRCQYRTSDPVDSQVHSHGFLYQ